MTRFRLAGLLAACMLTGIAAPAGGQQRIAVFPEPGTPVIATEILLATGPADEEEGEAGLAYLSARAVTRPIIPLLDSLDAHLTVTAEKDAIAFSLIAAPDAWKAATQLLMVALFRDPPAAAVIERERLAIQAELRGRASNPADAAERESDAAFFGAGHPWGRSTVGSAASVGRLTQVEVDDFLREHFTAESAVAVVVGPVTEEEARSHLRSMIAGTGIVPLAPPAADPAESPVRIDYNSITTWVSATFPFPQDADEESLRLLVHLASEELAFAPSRRSVYNVRSEVVPRRGGGEMRVTVVIPPDEAGAWVDRIERAVREIIDRPSLGQSWEPLVRKYRGTRLQQLDAPEDRAHEAARRLLVTGRGESPVPDLDRLTIARLRAAALYLGEPTTVFLGPILDDDG